MPTPKKPRGDSRLAKILKKNISVILDMREQKERQKSLQEHVADKITAFSGSMAFVYIHIVWFAIWISWNLGLLGLTPFDEFPFGLLTMIVSLEAIFLSTFVLVSQNRMSRIGDERDDLDLQVDMLGEYEVTKILTMLNLICMKMNIELKDPELQELEHEISTETLMREIERRASQNGK